MRKSLGGLALMLLMTACGSSTPSPFLGVWNITSGTQTLTCGGSPSQSAITGSLTIVQDPSGSDFLVSGFLCDETLTASSTAGAATTSSVSCAEEISGQAGTLTLTPENFSVSGTSLSESGSGTLLVSGATNGGSTTCTFSQSLSATKSAAN